MLADDKYSEDDLSDLTNLYDAMVDWATRPNDDVIVELVDHLESLPKDNKMRSLWIETVVLIFNNSAMLKGE